MRESTIEKYLVQRVKALGGEVRKVKWIGRNGAPDRLVMLNPTRAVNRLADVIDAVRGDPGRHVDEAALLEELFGMVCVWPELKHPGRAATFPADAHERGQHREHERMRRMGQRVVVVDSFEGVDEVLQ